jgi:5-methyltetrahydropteroyltriglutamate--homocysteine methyltransferase
MAVRDYEHSLVRDLTDLGCDYVQLDAPNYGFICDPRFREEMAHTGRDLAADIQFDAELDSSVFDGLGVTRAIHLCRGNSAGMWAASGGYEAVAEELFPRLRVDRLLLEYDTPRSGDFGALQHVPDDVTVVLGLLTTKQGDLEDGRAVEARIREAERLVPLDRLAVSPQCGFASVASGNPLTPGEQEQKLRLVGELAARVWG